MNLVDLRAHPALHEAVLALNALHEIETAPLDMPGLATRLSRACTAPALLAEDGTLLGFVLAFDPDSGLDGINFRWVRANLSRFIYIDRIITSAQARGLGVGRHLYACIEAHAQRHGARWLACEVNAEPPNPVSDAFHTSLGFDVFGTHSPVQGKTVRFMRRAVA